MVLPFAYRRRVSEAYFPDACFGDWHAQTAKSFERNLRALGEPSLWASRDERSGLRVLRLPTWKSATATRIEWSPSSLLSYRVCDGMAGFEPVGELRVSRERPLPPRRLERLRRAIDATRFFDVPTNERQLGVDGESWIVELAEAGRYHVVSRWSDPEGWGLPELAYLCRLAEDFAAR